MKIVTSKIILIKDIFGEYSAHYQDSLKGKLHKFTDEIEQVIYHGDFATSIGKNIVVSSMNGELEVEYVEKEKRLIISNDI
mgnify:CR=1 FL=1